MNSEQLTEMRSIITKTLGTSPAAAWQADAITEALSAAGFIKADRLEYAAKHEHSRLDVVDDDGDIMDDRDTFVESYEKHDSVTLLQRSVGPWVPLEPVA